VRFALSPQAYILGEIFKQIESSAGLPSKTFETLSNPAGAAADYVKTEAGNALLDQSNMSNIERILNELQPSQFEKARTAGETPADVPSSITAPTEPDQLVGMGGVDLPSLFDFQAPNVAIAQNNDYGTYSANDPNLGFDKLGGLADLQSGGGGKYYAMANGGFIYRGNR